MATNNSINTGKPIEVSNGGTGAATMTTAYAPVCAGTTATGALQVASTGLATSGFVLTSNGSSALPSFQSPSADLDYTLVSTSATPYVALSTDQVIAMDSSGGAKTVQLPNAPSAGRWFVVKDSTGSADSNSITVTTVGGVVLIDGSTSFVMNTEYESGSFVFDGTKYLVF